MLIARGGVSRPFLAHFGHVSPLSNPDPQRPRLYAALIVSRRKVPLVQPSTRRPVANREGSEASSDAFSNSTYSAVGGCCQLSLYTDGGICAGGNRRGEPGGFVVRIPAAASSTSHAAPDAVECAGVRSRGAIASSSGGPCGSAPADRQGSSRGGRARRGVRALRLRRLQLAQRHEPHAQGGARHAVLHARVPRRRQLHGVAGHPHRQHRRRLDGALAKQRDHPRLHGVRRRLPLRARARPPDDAVRHPRRRSFRATTAAPSAGSSTCRPPSATSARPTAATTSTRCTASTSTSASSCRTSACSRTTTSRTGCTCRRSPRTTRPGSSTACASRSSRATS